jgi:hypothetical protein
MLMPIAVGDDGTFHPIAMAQDGDRGTSARISR